MLERLTPARLLAAACALLVPLFVLGWLTREDPAEKPWLQVLGGGFIFNYRVSDVYYGFTAAVMRPLPTGSIVEAAFDALGVGVHQQIQMPADSIIQSSAYVNEPLVFQAEIGRVERAGEISR